MHPIEKELRKVATLERATSNARFFKSGKGEYGEGDLFLGVTVPDSRNVARKFLDTPLSQLESALESKWHEVRLTALLVLVEKFQSKRAREEEKKEILDFYLRHLHAVNNWDLVDLTASRILGEYLLDRKGERKILYDFARSNDLWKKRVGIISTLAFLPHHDYADARKLAEIYLHEKHDLMHKATGWVLREIGKRDEKELVDFLRKHYEKMPRTTLRYAIERFPEHTRKKYLRGEI